MLYFEDLQVGDSAVLGSHELLEEETIAYAQRWDPQPFHVDREAAARSPMKGLTASSCHTFAIASLLLSRMEVPIAVIGTVRHEMELPSPARPGDILSLRATYANKRPSESKPDRGLVTVDCVLSNQAGTAVLRLRSLIVVQRRPLADAPR
jgi:acyl dehydratase